MKKKVTPRPVKKTRIAEQMDLPGQSAVTDLVKKSQASDLSLADQMKYLINNYEKVLKTIGSDIKADTYKIIVNGLKDIKNKVDQKEM